MINITFKLLALEIFSGQFEKKSSLTQLYAKQSAYDLVPGGGCLDYSETDASLSALATYLFLLYLIADTGCTVEEAGCHDVAEAIALFIQQAWIAITKLLKLPIYLAFILFCRCITLPYECIRRVLPDDHPVTSWVFFLLFQLLAFLGFFIDLCVESICAPFQCLWFFIVPVIQQEVGLPSWVKGSLLICYSLCALLVATVVFSLLGLLPTTALPIGLVAASTALVHAIGTPLASTVFVLSGLYICAGLAYLGRVWVSRSLMMQAAWQTHGKMHTIVAAWAPTPFEVRGKHTRYMCGTLRTEAFLYPAYCRDILLQKEESTEDVRNENSNIESSATIDLGL